MVLPDEKLSEAIKKHREKHGHHISTLERHQIIAQAQESATLDELSHGKKVWQKTGFLQNPIDVEDGGGAQIAEFEEEKNIIENNDPNSSTGLFLKFHSYSETDDHSEFNKFIGKRLRITIEEIQDVRVFG